MSFERENLHEENFAASIVKKTQTWKYSFLLGNAFGIVFFKFILVYKHIKTFTNVKKKKSKVTFIFSVCKNLMLFTRRIFFASYVSKSPQLIWNKKVINNYTKITPRGVIFYYKNMSKKKYTIF